MRGAASHNLESWQKNKPKDATWAKIKFDHQIVAIAKVESVDTIYLDDGHIKTYASANNIETLGIVDLPKAPMKQESLLDYEASKKEWTSIIVPALWGTNETVARRAPRRTAKEAR
jgi:hypothetical protein